MAEKDKEAAVGGGLLGAAAGGAAGVGIGYLLGRAAEELEKVIVVYQLDEETRTSIAQSVAVALEPTLKELAMPEKAQKQIIFKHTVLPLQGIIDHKHVPLIKTANTITIHWPSGCSSLVKVAVGYSQDKRLLPEEGYLALDNATPTWTVNKDIEDTDTLWVEIRNGSTIHSYPISVIVNYEEL